LRSREVSHRRLPEHQPGRRCGKAGHDARHVAHVGKAGWKDWNVARCARDEDFILVTNNASDFRRLYATEPLHAGLVILIPALGRILQQSNCSPHLGERFRS
jgi:hypothetical protein